MQIKYSAREMARSYDQNQSDTPAKVTHLIGGCRLKEFNPN